MEIAKLSVSGVRVTRTDGIKGRWEIPAGIVGATIRFSYGANWKDLTPTVVFDGCGVTKDVVNAGQIVTVPAEVVARPERKLLVGVYGVSADGNAATPTLWMEGYVCAAADPSGDASTDPALPVWAQLEARIRALEARNTVCAVTCALRHVMISNPSATVTYHGTYTAQLTAEEGYVLDAVTVTMGGVDITADAYRDGMVAIGYVTGDVVITAGAVPIRAGFTSVDAPTLTGFALSSSGTLISASESWLYTHFLPVVSGQIFRYTGDTSAYGEYACVWSYDENGTAVQPLVRNGNHAAGVEFSIPEGVHGIRCCWYTGGSVPHSLEVRGDQQNMAGEVSFEEGITISGTGAEAAKDGGGATDYIPVSAGTMALVYNIVPANGGRFAFYDGNHNFLDAVTIYTQGINSPAIVSAIVTDANAAYVRISTNVLATVRAAAR